MFCFGGIHTIICIFKDSNVNCQRGKEDYMEMLGKYYFYEDLLHPLLFKSVVCTDIFEK